MATSQYDIFSTGLSHKFCVAFGKAGGTPELLNSLAQNRSRMRQAVELAESKHVVIRKKTTTLARAARQMFQPFMTLHIKAGTTPDDYRKSFEQKGINVGTYAGQTLLKVGTSAIDVELDVVKVSGAQLGFKNAVPRGEIYERAISYGLEKCPTQLGPQFRDEYTEKQPNGEWIIVASDPLSDAGGRPELFYVLRHDGKLWLDSYRDRPGRLWRPGHVWLFVLPRK